MKAAIIGYGKMGREIERILTERGHEAALVIDTDNAGELDAEHLAGIDVALEFTTPATAYANIRTCIENGTAVVSGTTGWTDRLAELQELCRERGGALFYASNYCLGVNLMFRLNRQLAAMIGRVGGYGVRIEEVHHTQKLDAPSGTAITLAEGILDNLADKQGWVNYARHEPRGAQRGHACRPDRNPLGARRRRPGHPYRDLRVGGRHAGTETHDQEPPHAGDGGRRGRRIPLRQTGRLRNGRPAAQLKMKN